MTQKQCEANCYLLHILLLVSNNGRIETYWNIGKQEQ